jgi:hypothetical protein
VYPPVQVVVVLKVASVVWHDGIQVGLLLCISVTVESEPVVYLILVQGFSSVVIVTVCIRAEE